jgi:hypothetical protein
VDILKNLSIIGALLMIAGFSPSQRIQGIDEPKFITP